MNLLAQGGAIGRERPGRVRRPFVFLVITAIAPVFSSFGLELPVFDPPVFLAPGGANSTFGWSASTNTNVAGYRLYYGTRSRIYSSMADAGNALQITVANLTNGVTYFLAVTAYTRSNVESDFSGELSYTPGTGSTNPALGATLTLTMTPQHVPLIQGSGIQAHTYELQATSNFVGWAAIGSVTADANGRFLFSDASGGAAPARFYRAKDLTQSTNPVQPVAPTLVLRMNPQKLPSLAGDGTPSHNYEVEATVDFGAWTAVGSVMADAGGHFTFTDSGAGAYSARFYRVKDLTTSGSAMTLLSAAGHLPRGGRVLSQPPSRR